MKHRALLIIILACVVAGLSGCADTVTSKKHGSASMAGQGMPKTQPDPLATRYILMRAAHTSEEVHATYFHDGHYDPKIMQQINILMRDRHANVVGPIDPELIDYMVDIRTRLGLPPTVVFDILSGYRTRETNRQLSFANKQVAPESLHMHGWAVDFRIEHVSGNVIAEIAKTMQRGGVAYYPNDNHVHVDLGNIRTWR